jgi:hypothetical protein
MKKTIIIAILFFLYIVIGKELKNVNESFLFRNLSDQITKPLIKYVFPYRQSTILKKEIAILLRENKILTKKIRNERTLIQNYDEIYFNTNLIFNKDEDKNIYYNGKKIDIFTNYALTRLGPRAFIETYKDKIYLLSGSGLLFNLDEKKIHNQEKFVMKVLKSNLRKMIGTEYINNHRYQTILNMLIKDDNIYVSYIKKINESCYKNSILKSSINENELNFKEFFIIEKCMNRKNKGAGGAIENFNDQYLIYTIGTYWDDNEGIENLAQKLDNPFGKIFLIDKNSGNKRLVSIGHRTLHGVYFDQKKNMILSTDMAAKGGDEINIHKNLEKIENFGWGTSSYGNHYNNIGPKEKYLNFPFHKSHKKYGFVEPLHIFDIAVAPTSIVKIENNLNENIFVVGSMGYFKDNHSLHFFTYDNNYEKQISHEVVNVFGRVRDITIYKNKLFFYEETNGSIGILDLN